jgi:hypothetical protein
MIKVLMLAHGMGVHDGADWSTGAIKAVLTAAEAYGLESAFSLDLDENRVTLAPIGYDKYFQQWLDLWGKNTPELLSFVKANSIGVPGNVISWLSGVDEVENNFFWTHVVDVVLYRYFDIVRRDVRVHVMRDVARTWRDALVADPSADVSLLAHSLGTSVLHDSLAALGSSPPEGADGFLAGTQRLGALFMLANVSRILETAPLVYDSVVCPPSVRGAKAYCGALFNVRHELDPFPAPRTFKPAWGGEDYVDIRTSAIREFNVHSLERYIEDPRVHIPLFRMLFGFSAIDEATASARIDEYDASPGPPCPERLKEFIKDCRNRVQLITESNDVKTLLSAGVRFLADVDEVRQLCANIA